MYWLSRMFQIACITILPRGCNRCQDPSWLGPVYRHKKSLTWRNLQSKWTIWVKSWKSKYSPSCTERELRYKEMKCLMRRSKWMNKRYMGWFKCQATPLWIIFCVGHKAACLSLSHTRHLSGSQAGYKPNNNSGFTFPGLAHRLRSVV